MKQQHLLTNNINTIRLQTNKEIKKTKQNKHRHRQTDRDRDRDTDIHNVCELIVK